MANTFDAVQSESDPSFEWQAEEKIRKKSSAVARCKYATSASKFYKTRNYGELIGPYDTPFDTPRAELSLSIWQH